MRRLRPYLATIATTVALFSAPASAEEEAPASDALASAVPPAASPAPALWANGSVVDEGELSRQRGGADLHLNENNASALVSDNIATNLDTGNNSISGEAFSGMSGVPMVVQNSGNNVVIQNSTILNLQLQ